MNENLIIKVTNHLTGEISEIEITGGDQAANVMHGLMASQKAIETAVNKLKVYISDYIGDSDKEQRVGDYIVKRVQRETRTWTTDGLRTVGFDMDAIEVVLKVNMPVAKQLVDEAIERGEIAPDSKKTLQESAEISVSKPFLTFKENKS